MGATGAVAEAVAPANRIARSAARRSPPARRRPRPLAAVVRRRCSLPGGAISLSPAIASAGTSPRSRRRSYQSSPRSPDRGAATSPGADEAARRRMPSSFAGRPTGTNRTPMPSGTACASGRRRRSSLHVRDHDDLAPRRRARGQPPRRARQAVLEVARVDSPARTLPFAVSAAAASAAAPSGATPLPSATRMLSLCRRRPRARCARSTPPMRASVRRIGPAERGRRRARRSPPAPASAAHPTASRIRTAAVRDGCTNRRLGNATRCA